VVSVRSSFLLALVTVVGAVLRAIGLGTSLWVDEVLTVRDYVRLPLRELLTSYGSENQHPLYSLLAHASVACFGEHEWSVRLPAVIFGTAAIPALARLGRQVAGETAGLLAALLLAVSYHPIWFSQDARGYTGLLFFTLLATSDLISMIQGDPQAPRKGLALRYAAWLALAAWVHLTALFVFAGHGLVWAWLFLRKRAPARPLFAMLLGLLLAALLYAPMLDDVVRAFAARAVEESKAVVRVSKWTSPAWALEQVRTSLGTSAATYSGLALVAGLAGVGFVSLWRKARLVVLLHMSALPIALAFLLLLKRHLYPRFFFFEAGFALLVVTQGALMSGGWLSCNLPGCKSRRSATWGIAVALLVAAASTLTLTRLYAHPKQDFVGARDLVEARAGPNDAKVAVGPAKVALPGYYAPSWSSVDDAAELERLRASAPQVWVVYVLPDQLEEERPEIAALLAREFEPVVTLPGSLNGGEVHIVRSRDSR
jgi:4-amino-4-deoxy-L-arabinose transferase-like glycosyltransferase